MTSVRIGGYSQSRQGSRRMCKVVVFPQIVLVDNQPIYSGIGFQRDVSLSASRRFTNILYEISQKVAAKQPKGVDILDEVSEIAFQKSLFIEEDNYKRFLFDLVKIGAGLRSDLSVEMVNAFKSLGFFKENTQEYPGFTFLEDITQPNSQAPVLWEMMYEGDLVDDLKWQNFWGFIIPISHWITGNRSTEIRLQKAFSAIHEDLKFAGRETSLLTKKLVPELFHANLINVCRDKVEKDLGNNDCHDKLWLHKYLSNLFQNNNPELETERWKMKILKSIFKDSKTVYDLIHFACHCEGNQTEFLSQLIMKVGGESINLDVAFIKSTLKRQDSWDANERGPLVFLNACGTFEQNISHEPPGFPTSWIESQGALAVIGTLCPIPDYFAYAFARKFYEILFQAIANPDIVRECYLSEALLITRRYFMEKYNNPLGLAYVLYAVDGAHVLADFVQTGDAA